MDTELALTWEAVRFCGGRGPAAGRGWGGKWSELVPRNGYCPTCSRHLTSVPGPQLVWHCPGQPPACSSRGMHCEGMLSTRSLPRQSLTAPWHSGQPSHSDCQIAGDQSGPCMGPGSCWSQRLNCIWQGRTNQCLLLPAVLARQSGSSHTSPPATAFLPTRDGKGNFTHLSTHGKGLWPGSLRGGLPLPGRSVS